MKLPGGIGELLANAQKIQQNMAEMKVELEKKRILGDAGGAMVEIIIDGAMHVHSVRIDPALLSSGDRDMIQDLFRAAANDALHKAKENLKSELSRLSGGFPIPGLFS